MNTLIKIVSMAKYDVHMRIQVIDLSKYDHNMFLNDYFYLYMDGELPKDIIISNIVYTAFTKAYMMKDTNSVVETKYVGYTVVKR